MSIKELIKILANDKSTFNAFLAKITKIDNLEAEISPLSGGEIKQVRLVTAADSLIKYTPAIGSTALIVMLNDIDCIVVICSKYDKIEISCNDIVFNSGTLGGLTDIEILKTALNSLQTSVDGIKNVISAFTPADHGAAMVTLRTSVFPTLTPIEISNIENEKIKHG